MLVRIWRWLLPRLKVRLKRLIRPALVLACAALIFFNVTLPRIPGLVSGAADNTAGSNHSSSVATTSDGNAGDTSSTPTPGSTPTTSANPAACAGAFPRAWANQIVPAIVAYMSFPTKQPLTGLLDDMQQGMTDELFNAVSQSWQATIAPRYYTMAASVTTCQLGALSTGRTTITVGVQLQSQDTAGQYVPDTDVFYDVTVQNNQPWLITTILPSGSQLGVEG